MKRDPCLEQWISVHGDRLLRQMSEGVLGADAAGIVRYANPAAVRLFGQGDLGGRRVTELLPVDSLPALESHPDGEPAPIRKPDGTPVWLTWKSGPIGDGEASGTLLTIKDVTQEVLWREKVKKSERARTQAARLAQLGYWEWDLSQNRIFWSEEIRKILGLAASETMLLDDCFRMLHPDDRPRVLRQVEAALQGEGWEMEFRILHPDGSIRVIRQSGELVRDEDGTPVWVSGTVQDITSEKAAEKALALSEVKFRSVVQSAKDGIILGDHTGCILSWNQGAEAIFGYREKEALGKPLSLILPSHLLGSYAAELERQRRDHRVVYPSRTAEIRGIRKDGTEIPVEIVFGSRGQGENRVFFGIVRDIRERKKTEEMLRQSEKLTVVGQLAAGVAHEIRNPLTALRGFVQLKFDGGEVREIMLSELDRIESICREFLLLAKPQPLRFEEVEPLRIKKDVVTLLQSQALLQRIMIITETDHPLPPIRCELNQVKQALMNLIKNAMEAMPDGGTLHVRLAGEPDGVRFTVIDEGGGIPPEHLRRLGEPFFTTKEEGTGLGLMITRQIIHHHGGTLAFKSKIGKGTTVTMRLPAVPAVDTAVRIPGR